MPPNVVAFAALLLATTLIAFRSGGQPERATAIVFLAGFVATVVGLRGWSVRFASIEPYVAAIDIAVLTGLTLILIRADRFWPIAQFAAQGVAVLVHLVKLIDPSIVRRAYAIAIAVPGWLTLVILLVAVWRHAHRVEATGPERDWS